MRLPRPAVTQLRLTLTQKMISTTVFQFKFVVLLCVLPFFLFSACGQTYPKGNLVESVQKLFRKELGVEVRTQLAGKTLYVSFQIKNLMTKNFELPREVTDKLQDAMVSISRIALSTDAEIHFTVVEARDVSWGIQINLIRRTQDLKDLYYWRISKTDFDERLVLETKKVPADSTSSADRVSPSRVADRSADKPASSEEKWHDLTLPEFMGRWVASRISMGTLSNPFLNVLLGIKGMDARYDSTEKNLHLIVDGYSNFSSTSTHLVTLDLLKNSIKEQMSQVESKYPPADSILVRKGTPSLVDADWTKNIIVENQNRQTLFEIPRREWKSLQYHQGQRRS